MAERVKDERDGMDQLLKDLAFLEGNVVDSGILANPQGQKTFNADVIMIDDNKRQNENSFTVGNVAGFHEFGFGVPERSFVRSTFDRETLAIEGEISDNVNLVFHGKSTAPKAMASIGEFASEKMKETIELSIDIVPLSEERLAQKKMIGTPSTPLINWGIMIETLDYQVHRGN